MPANDDPTQKTWADLSITNLWGVGILFTQLRVRFLSDLARASEQGNLESVVREWTRSLGGGESVPGRISANWVQTAPDTIRHVVFQELENLVSFINIRLTAGLTLEKLGADNPARVGLQFENLRIAFDAEIQQCRDETDLGVSKVAWLGRRSGILKLVADNWLKPSSPELKRAVGAALNELRAHVEAQIEERRKALEASSEQTALARERVDLSLPGVERPIGSRHLIRQVQEEIESIFLSIGFSVVEGPEIETPYYNFEALNIPEYHPVRDDMDTFYLEVPSGVPPLLLRTHTSPMQIRAMEKQKPPVRIIVPGKVYRRDNPDATHSFMFHQIEGLAVDTDITFCEFKGTMEYFVRQFFGQSVKTRLRPSYFPFTEPSAELDASCIFCGGRGTGCAKCKGSGWIELFGAGMVDPAVYGFVKYDAKKISGFAFGLGPDRMAMLKYGVEDIQVFFQNDVRFLRQFP